MKKKSIFISIFTLILCVTFLAGITAPKKPILAKEMSSAEEVVEYYDDINTSIQNTTEDNDNTSKDDCCQTTVFVVGTAKLNLSPDMATITACIEKFNEDLASSKNENLEILNNVMEALKSNGINEKDISLDFFNAHPSYDFTAGRLPIGYNCKSCFSFKVNNLDTLSEVIGILTDNGVTEICNICYSVSDLEQQYTNALSQALDNAKAKASILLGCENLEICRIKEECSHMAISLCRQFVDNLNSSLVGTVTVEAKVSAVIKCA